MKDQGNLAEFEQELSELLDSLKPTSLRDAGSEALGRKRFLAEARRYRTQYEYSNRFNQSPLARLQGWLGLSRTRYSRIRHVSAFSVVISVLVCMVLVFQATGTVIYAAEISLPNQPMYALKTWVEDVRLQFTPSEEEKIDLLLQYNERRLTEATTLVQNGQAIPQVSANSIEKQTSQALEIATGMEEEQMLVVLENISTELRNQERIVQENQESTPEAEDPELARIRETLRNQVELAEMGMESPVEFKHQLQNRRADDKGNSLPGGNDLKGNDSSPGSPEGNGGQEQPSPESGSGSGSGPNFDPGNMSDHESGANAKPDSAGPGR